MDHFRTNIAIIPKASTLEKIGGLIVAGLIFIPFILGFILENKMFFISLPAGIVLILIFNLITKGKFSPKNWVQKDSFIEFTRDGLKVINNSQVKEFLWSELTAKSIQVIGYDGEAKPHSDSGTYNGTKNKIIFAINDTKFEINFYLKNAYDKERFKSFMETKESGVQDTNLTSGNRLWKYDTEASNFKRAPDQKEELTFSKKQKGCLMLFALPFVIAGVWTFGMSIYQFSKVIQAREWVPLHATVLSEEVNITSSSGSTGVEVAYEYVVANKVFKGNSISFSAGRNNFDSHHTLYEKIKNAKVIEIYVNENNPDESVVIRGVTNDIIFIATFSLMWNSFLLSFLFPFLFPSIFERLKWKYLLIITVLIWTFGISKFAFRVGDIDLSEQLVVIEARENTQ